MVVAGLAAEVGDMAFVLSRRTWFAIEYVGGCVIDCAVTIIY